LPQRHEQRKSFWRWFRFLFFFLCLLGLRFCFIC
jgi:hypothetical protein